MQNPGDEPRPKKQKFQCETCHETFTKRKNLQRHTRDMHAPHTDADKLTCRTCHKRFSRKESLVRHLKKNHAFKCGKCFMGFENEADWKRHLNSHPEQTALQGCAKVKKYDLRDLDKTDASKVLTSLKESIQKDILEFLTKKGSLMAYAAMRVQFVKAVGVESESQPFFRGSNFVVLKQGDEVEHLDQTFLKILENMVKYQKEGSNWTLKEVIAVQLHVVRYKPMLGSSYIPTPDWLKKKHAVVNVQNKSDNECFKWSLLAALYNVKKDAQRLSHYRKSKFSLNFDGLEFPIKLDDVRGFEQQNEYSVNVLGYNKENNFKPLHVSEKRQGNEKHINLLLITEGDKSHYCWIRDFSRLMGDQKKDNTKHYYCHFCFYHSKSESRVNEHTENCRDRGGQIETLPGEEDKILSFGTGGIQKCHKVPVVIYADFECLLVPAQRDENSQRKEVLKIHEPCGFAYTVVGLTEECSKPVYCYRGEDAADKFIERMLEEKEWFQKLTEKKLNMTDEEKETFSHAQNCFLCNEPFEKSGDKVKDHCHFSGKYRGAAHNKCNVNYKKRSNFLPVIIHNLRGYDSHIIIKANTMEGLKIECIPQSIEKYIMFKVGGCLQFIDSNLFLSSSLEKLVGNLAKSASDRETNFKHTLFLASRNTTKLNLLLRKQVYPYEYMDSSAKFVEECLPPIEMFASNGENLSVKDYQHAREVWKTFGIKTLGDYHDLYVKSDVLLLADVFESFRNFSLENYVLDPAHFYSTPGLAWQAALKKSGVKLELITDLDMYRMIESGIRGGVAMISKRFSQANHPNAPDFEPNKPKTWIIYLDANNLYGWAMSQRLPIGELKWLEPKKVKKLKKKLIELDFQDVGDDTEVGYILEVDLEYPEELHDGHNDFPLAPEKIELTSGMLSPYCKTLFEELGMKEPNGDRLIPNLGNKEKYVVHYRTLKLYLNLGMKLTEVYRVISFHQTPWLEQYIDTNTQKRKESTSDVQKDFFKLMNNSVYGKTLENVRKYKDVKFITDESKLTKLTAKPLFDEFRIFNENLVAVEIKKRTVNLNKPIHVGFTVLELAKYFIYDFHYNRIRAKYGDKARLLFTDTDSLCYEIETEDIYDDMKKDAELYDFSNYPENHSLFDVENKNVVGKMKDETAGIPVEGFVGLRPKMYCLKYGDDEKKAAHGISREHRDRNLRFQNYKECLDSRTTQEAVRESIGSVDHELRTVRQTRVSLSPYDDKRYILGEGIESLAYGHCDIRKSPSVIQQEAVP